jgi:hypothetical protein
MNPANLVNSEFFSSHWAIVVGIGLMFLLVQIALSLRLYLRARQQHRILVALAHDFEEGGDGRGDLRWLPKNFTWLNWVLSVFPAGATIHHDNYSRDDVLQELDTRIASDSDYLLLQRLGIMAPLLGVILTVIGFYWLEVDESEAQTLQSILLAVTPLVSGVGTGAALALINQALLHAAGRRVERMRISARTWFDSVIWSNIGTEEEAVTGRASAALDRFARLVNESADRYTTTTQQIEESTAAIRGASSRFDDAIKSFSGEVTGVAPLLADLQKAIAASSDALRELIPVGSRAVANLDVSVAAFRSTIDREFSAAAKLHQRSSKVLSQSVQQLGQTAELIKSGADELKHTALSSNSALQGRDETQRPGPVLANRQFSDAVQTLWSQMAVLTNVVGSLSGNVEAMVPAQQIMHEAATRFAESAAKLADLLERRLAPAVAQLAAVRETLAEMQDGVRSVQSLGHAQADIDRLTEMLAGAAEIANAISSLPELIRDVLEQNAAQDPALESSRSGFKSWLPGRPR